MSSLQEVTAAVLQRRTAPHLRAVEILRPMRGGSQPWLLRCDDGCCYVVKFRDNPQHVRVLANEMLAGLLSRLIGLPAAEPAFVEVSEKLLLHSAAQSSPFPAACGLHFGSRLPGDPAEISAVEFLPDRLLERVSNLQEAFHGALVFDKWTCNCDGRQVVFYRQLSARRSGYTVCLIDQGFCFNDGDWSFPDSATRSLYPRRMVYKGVRGIESFEPFLTRIEHLREETLLDCARTIPPEWCDGDSEGPLRLMEALYMRRRKLRQALVDVKNSALSPFPNWK